MKAYLAFNLNSEEDKERFEEIANGEASKFKAALWEFSQNTLRRYRKYELPLTELKEKILSDAKQFNTPESITIESMLQTFVEHIETKFYETLEEYDVKID